MGRHGWSYRDGAGLASPNGGIRVPLLAGFRETLAVRAQLGSWSSLGFKPIPGASHLAASFAEPVFGR